FDPILNLPSRTEEKLELAIGSATAPRPLLRRAGWYLRDPLQVTRDPWSFQRYIEQSKAEFTVAKQGYVISNSGWFSERSANYRASGRPVVTQQTGFSRWLQADAGVMPFNTAEEALSAIENVSAHYDAHCRAAREIVHEYFDANKVLEQLLNKID
ncbi:MAG: glycosyltransferase, partial [Thermomicrobiales bacterium]